MNKKRRTTLNEADGILAQALSIIEGVLSEEQDCLDNLNTNFEETDLYKAIEKAVDALADAIEKIKEAQESLQEAVS